MVTYNGRMTATVFTLLFHFSHMFCYKSIILSIVNQSTVLMIKWCLWYQDYIRCTHYRLPDSSIVDWAQLKPDASIVNMKLLCALHSYNKYSIQLSWVDIFYFKEISYLCNNHTPSKSMKSMSL